MSENPLASEYQNILSFTDTATGYGITVTSRLLPHPNRDRLTYMFGVHLPDGGAPLEFPIETNPLRTNGTGLV